MSKDKHAEYLSSLSQETQLSSLQDAADHIDWLRAKLEEYASIVEIEFGPSADQEVDDYLKETRT